MQSGYSHALYQEKDYNYEELDHFFYATSNSIGLDGV